MSQPTDQDDALLLEELMNGPPGAAAPSGDDGAGIGGGGGSNGFSAQWSALLASKKQDPSPEAEFTDLMASHASAATAPLQQPTSSSLQPQSATQQQQQQGGFLLPSQLFDMDQSLYSGKRSTGKQGSRPIGAECTSNIVHFQLKKICSGTFPCPVQLGQRPSRRRWPRRR